MSHSRRDFIRSAAITAAAWPLALSAQSRDGSGSSVFRHGVASGDPLADRVILWTRVTAETSGSSVPGPLDVRWEIGTDEALTRIVSRGTATATPERDFTVKADATGLQAGRTYFYAFTAQGERSPIGRTRTLPAGGTTRLRLGVVSCSNYPAGYFNVYRCLANRPDIDAVVHLGDYIYEFADGVYGDTKAIGRPPMAGGEATTLADYRGRYAIYRSDPDLQEVHRRHPFFAVWDDHESANDSWSGGARAHTAKQGNWATRFAGAYRAYVEWLPIREAPEGGIHLYRSFRIGDLADLVMLDTRGLRDEQLPGASGAALNDPRRTLLGAAQEAWLFDQLRGSMRRNARWRILGQQVLLASITPSGPAGYPDVWDGYPAARARVLEFLRRENVTDVAVLTGDLHSSWALEVPLDPWQPAGSPGTRPVAVEFVTPAVSSPPIFAEATQRERLPKLREVATHVKYLEGDHNGYLLLDVTRDRVQADWYFVPNVMERGDKESRAVSFVCERGSSRLIRA